MLRRLLPMIAMLATCAVLPSAIARPDAQVPAFKPMHEAFVQAFIDSQGFGKRRVTPMMEQMRRYQWEGIGEDRQCVHDVELIGIARHDPPVVHASNFMGFQHGDGSPVAVSAPPVRALLPWESEAIARLRAGESLVLHQDPAGRRMVGPIRARPDCLSCHGRAHEGDLLGALSYGLGHIENTQGAPAQRTCRP